jgi:hypothetical protein
MNYAQQRQLLEHPRNKREQELRSCLLQEIEKDKALRLSSIRRGLNLNQLLSKSDVKDAFNDEDTKKEPDCKLSEIEVVETPGKVPLFIDLKSDEIKKLFYELVFRC